jgi:hypothetical protein
MDDAGSDRTAVPPAQAASANTAATAKPDALDHLFITKPLYLVGDQSSLPVNGYRGQPNVPSRLTIARC